MTEISTRFGNAAVYMVLAHYCVEFTISEENWKSVIKKFLNKNCYIEKACPKNTFLSMCSKGFIKDVPAKNYITYETVEFEYAKIAINLLKKNNCLATNPRELWKEVLKEGKYDNDKKYNYQMDIVCALWNADLIVKDFA